MFGKDLPNELPFRASARTLFRVRGCNACNPGGECRGAQVQGCVPERVCSAYMNACRSLDIELWDGSATANSIVSEATSALAAVAISHSPV